MAAQPKKAKQMLDDRTMRRSPKAEVLKSYPDAECSYFPGIGRYIVEIGGGEKGIGFGRNAWAAWMDAEGKLFAAELEARANAQTT